MLLSGFPNGISSFLLNGECSGPMVNGVEPAVWFCDSRLVIVVSCWLFNETS